MNKKTRIFIFNLLVVIICFVGVSIHIAEMRLGTWNADIFNIVLLSFSSIGCLLGTFGIFNSLR